MALLPLLLLAGGPSANADITLPWPGLPTITIPGGMSAGVMNSSWGNGISEVARARQWVKIPAQAVIAAQIVGPSITYPADDPQRRKFDQVSHISLFLSSPAGAKKGYGVGMPTTVRAVAFGSIPVQVAIRIEQVRDADDLPVPLQLTSSATVYQPPGKEVRPGVFSDTRATVGISGKVRVRLTALAVDGIDVALGDCVSAPVDLQLQGNPWWKGDPLTDPFLQPFAAGSAEWTNWLAARGVGTLNGGAASGEIDIPAFSHCLTAAGEDLSPLLTNAVSGPGNPVTVGFAAITGMPPDKVCGSLRPGTNIPTLRGPFSGDPSDCDPAWGPPMFDYPTRGH